MSNAHYANLTPWKPGQSGNPAGRPKMPADIRALLTEKTPEALRRLWELTGGEDKRLALMALVRWLEYSLGKPTQAIEMNIEDSTQPATLESVDRARRIAHILDIAKREIEDAEVVG